MKRDTPASNPMNDDETRLDVSLKATKLVFYAVGTLVAAKELLG